MHATRDTTAVIFGKVVGGRVMRGVRLFGLYEKYETYNAYNYLLADVNVNQRTWI
jgi:hypothetical protein